MDRTYRSRGGDAVSYDFSQQPCLYKSAPHHDGDARQVLQEDGARRAPVRVRQHLLFSYVDPSLAFQCEQEQAYHSSGTARSENDHEAVPVPVYLRHVSAGHVRETYLMGRDNRATIPRMTDVRQSHLLRMLFMMMMMMLLSLCTRKRMLPEPLRCYWQVYMLTSRKGAKRRT
ncbi:hypothetical protein LTR85_002720 [Meristemomyces frigidus]|nr:hypothetical protein LTR85_002720 [Meristemomyces frigidus]